MFLDQSVVLYACVSRRSPTIILADFNPRNDPEIEASALECLHNTPPHHSTFSHTNDNTTYAYLIADDDSAVIFFGIFDAVKTPEGTPLLFLNRVKDKFNSVVVVGKRKNRGEGMKVYRGLQSVADELFREPSVSREKGGGLKGLCLRFLGLAMCVVDANKKFMMKKKKHERSSFGSDEHSDCALVTSYETTTNLKQERT
ncbi:hypothetical protein QQ045_027593 [Rhodiola kirilowii]